MSATDLDVDMMRHLYAAGCLIVYRTIYFDSCQLTTVSSKLTFSEDAARAEFDRLKKARLPGGIESFRVSFDGAFGLAGAKKPA